ncbi:helix-turn-helix domain-containing protein [Kribbella sp. C-35]|uniref:AlbA family DNA-binding domain-containing protein n=1 Tax=Kribbella sp. C-35 TaxID=2789276 RepID=UPI00397B35B0
MLEWGESGRFEFKRDAEAVSPAVLATLANCVASDESRVAAHLLVGVDEREDSETGLVSGVPHGLAKGLDRAVARIQDVASKTRPIPVDLFIVEEAVGTDCPFLRIEVRPTMPPHFDDQGRRQTRQGRSTRALTDDELLRIYLDREAGSFAARFRQTARELHEAVGGVGTQIDQIAAAIEDTIAQPVRDLTDTAESAALSASAAESAAEDVAYSVSNLDARLALLHSLIADVHGVSPEALAARVATLRREVWLAFAVDTWERTSAQATRLEETLRNLLARDIAVAVEHNAHEIRVWSDLLEDRKALRKGHGALNWWRSALDEATRCVTEPAYGAPDLPNLRAEMKADIDKALDDPESLTRRFVDLLD